MGCLIIRGEDDNTIFMCGEELKPEPCRDCGYESDYLCDFPVGNDKTCDARLCRKHAHEVAPEVHYCNAHFEEWKKFQETGGVKKVLENVIPFNAKYIR